MEESVNAFDLSQEQQDTASLLDRLLGKAIADRYVDFCRLAAGAFALNVSRPVAAHALRELDSTLRHVLEVPMDAKAPEPPDDEKKLNEARQQLVTIGFDEPAIQRAIGGLKPRLTHKTQIRKIVARLRLDPDGDIASRWTSLCDSFGRAHQRSFHHSLKVDDEFRAQYQQPFDTVIRAVAVALESRYAALMHRVEELAALPDRARAASAFASEIPGALPLQWHFFQRLTTGDWLPHLAKKDLLGEPLAMPEASSGGMRHRQWPAGNYLKRMAESPDRDTRKRVVEALCEVAGSKHPDIHSDGLEIIAALPPEESAPLTDMAVGWLTPEERYGILQAPETLLTKLAEGGQHTAALRVARALMQLWNENGEIANLYGRHMYEHHLPSVVQTLTKACANDALTLFMELLLQAAQISRKIEYDHHSSQPFGDEATANYDVYSALLNTVRRSAETLITDNPAQMGSVIRILTQHPARLFVRLALHMLAKNPAAAPDLADAYLLNAELIEQTWAHLEYAKLALAWFPSRSAAQQQQVLAVVDAMPDKYRSAWRERFKEHHKAAPTPEDDRIFNEYTIRDALWNWRSALPPARQQTIDRIVAEHGDPDAWRTRMFPEEVSPLSSADFTARSAPEVIAFLKKWQPSKGEQQSQTVTALAQELRTAVDKDPNTFAANADQFAELKPIYIRRMMEGLQSVTSNRREFDWSKVLKLVEFTYGQYNRAIDPASLVEGDDKNWSWACMTASELLAAGLRQGAKGIGFEHATLVRSLVFTVLKLAPSHPELEDFEDRFRREPHFAAQATLRGISVELCILLIFWLSKDASNPIGAAPREALQNMPDIRQVLEAQLADRSPDGRVPRAILGRYLRWLFYFGEVWLKAHMAQLFPADDDRLRRAAWAAHLGHDQGPLQDLVAELHSSYAEGIARLATEQDRDFRDFYQDRLADYILVLHLWDELPEELLTQFWKDAPLKVRQHAMWFVGIQISKPETPDDVKARGLVYWERRLAEAMQSPQPDAYRKEVGGIGQWCFHGQVDETWLCVQLLRMLGAGFVPNDAYSVVQWLQKIIPQHIDRAVEVMSALLRHPLIDQWAYMTQREAIRAVLSEGLASGTPETIQRVHETIGFLSTIGETSYLDLVRPTTAK